MNLLIRLFFGFLIAAILAGVLMGIFGVAFGTIDYWHKHGVFLLVFLALFPRLTLLFSSLSTGGFFWWLAWIFAPRFLVAVLATISYWQTNPLLVSFSWIFAIGGESVEKVVVRKRVVWRARYRRQLKS